MRWGVYEILLCAGYSYCARCGRVKRVHEFDLERSRKSGLNYYCKACKATYRNGRKPDEAKPIREHVGRLWKVPTELQAILERVLPREQFTRDASASHGLHSNCKHCRSKE